MENEIWQFEQQTRILREFLEQTNGIWRDSAAKEITTNLLEPHQISNEQMLRLLKQQLEALATGDAKLQQIFEQTNQMEVVFEQMEAILQFVEADLVEAGQYVSQNHRQLAQVNTDLQNLEELIKKANAAGNGVSLP